LSSSLYIHKLAADGDSSFRLRLGGGSRRRLLRLLQGLTPLVEFGGGSWLVSGFLRPTGARAAIGRPCCLGVVVCNFQIVQGSFCNLTGCSVLKFNGSPCFAKKKKNMTSQKRLEITAESRPHVSPNVQFYLLRNQRRAESAARGEPKKNLSFIIFLI
jgi:hypothetical protein